MANREWSDQDLMEAAKARIVQGWRAALTSIVAAIFAEGCES
jgi:hypothetical protein